MDAETALKTFELANSIQTTSDPSLSVAQLRRDIETSDSVYKYDDTALQSTLAAKPWASDPHYFKHIRISAVALIKMVMHARSGGNIEVMGMIQGKVEGSTMIVMDVFALPVEGSETRVNAQAEAYEHIVKYTELIKQVGRLENTIGWYHSHPGYGCWLSGIDVTTQSIQQKYSDPFVAIVVDPARTISAGKVDIGAFRTYPEGYKAPDEGPQEYQTIPLSKIEDFGVHAKHYYPLEISYFKSTLDSKLLSLLWSKYWVNTLSSNPWLANREFIANQIMDLSMKLEQAENQLTQNAKSFGFNPYAEKKKKEESQLSKIAKDNSKTSGEAVHAMMGQVLKDFLFNHSHHHHDHQHQHAADADDAMVV